MNKKKKQNPISLYPLKFDEVISDALKVKPEPKQKHPSKAKGKPKSN